MSKKLFYGNESDRIPNIAFQLMAFIFKIREHFIDPEKTLKEFDIQFGQTIIDYGCGPGIFIKKASELAGPEGLVIAMDVHELAIRAINKRIKKHNLKNVKAVIARGNDSTLDDNTADIIYALDMFHMVKETSTFLKELNRIIQPDGVLFIEDGHRHQSRENAKTKIIDSGFWNILEENEKFMKCSPIK